VIFFLLFGFTLSFIQSQFTAFRPVQVDFVHAKDGSFPQNVRIDSPVRGNPEKSKLALEKQRSAQVSVRSGLPLSTGDIVQQSKAASENVKSLFFFLGNITIVPEVFDHVFKSNGCLENIQDAIELMDNSYELVAKNAPEIIYLEAIVENLMHEKNITKLLRVSSKMLRLFEDLIPKLPVKIEKRCFSSLRNSAEDFKSLAHLLIDVLNHRDINLPEESRQLIQRRTKTMSATSKFLVIINKALTIFESLCNNKQSRYTAANKSLGKVMKTLAALYEVLGSESKSKDVMRQGDIIMRILESFRDSDELKSKLTCGANGAYEELAITLDDLAEIVQSVGLKALSPELGVDLEFRLNFNRNN